MPLKVAFEETPGITDAIILEFLLLAHLQAFFSEQALDLSVATGADAYYAWHSGLYGDSIDSAVRGAVSVADDLNKS